MKELQDKKFAEEVRNRVMTEEQIDQAKKEELRQRMEKYKQQLNGQIEEARNKRRYGEGGLMTEHERKINDRDIKAYMEMDNQSVYNRGIPGIQVGHELEMQQKYIGKLFQASNMPGMGGYDPSR